MIISKNILVIFVLSFVAANCATTNNELKTNQESENNDIIFEMHEPEVTQDRFLKGDKSSIAYSRMLYNNKTLAKPSNINPTVLKMLENNLYQSTNSNVKNKQKSAKKYSRR